MTGSISLAAFASAGSQEVLEEVQRALNSWDTWAWISKTGAVFLGVIVSACGVLIASKQLPDNWHYGVSAFVAACVFAYGLLQPYEEYKQFRLAQYKLHGAYMAYLISGRSSDDLTALKTAFDEARNELKEDWVSPSVSASTGKAPS
ncbi:hypothetical protein [Cupriavidus pampae]|uniref:SMODS and SLOG-associating 2TM effector domain-containing protein n=1 Tax=Cupriavidus pampae TaxID=659251 RepID=A0ABN7YL32_9BURK|nr:hypothetical protein [Cupriavidus pampae]CAG9172567.1 hypothetical protein LMG32289_02623 [Cupriavidus pampae]